MLGPSSKTDKLVAGFSGDCLRCWGYKKEGSLLSLSSLGKNRPQGTELGNEGKNGKYSAGMVK